MLPLPKMIAPRATKKEYRVVRAIFTFLIVGAYQEVLQFLLGFMTALSFVELNECLKETWY